MQGEMPVVKTRCSSTAAAAAAAVAASSSTGLGPFLGDYCEPHHVSCGLKAVRRSAGWLW